MTIKKILLAGLFFALAGCGGKSHNTGADGYYFEQSSFEHTDFPVHIVLVESDQEMRKLITEHMSHVVGEVNPKNVAAFSVLHPNDSACTIYMIDPKVRYEPEFYGHELVHCIYGKWHHEPQN